MRPYSLGLPSACSINGVRLGGPFVGFIRFVFVGCSSGSFGPDAMGLEPRFMSMAGPTQHFAVAGNGRAVLVVRNDVVTLAVFGWSTTPDSLAGSVSGNKAEAFWSPEIAGLLGEFEVDGSGFEGHASEVGEFEVGECGRGCDWHPAEGFTDVGFGVAGRAGRELYTVSSGYLPIQGGSVADNDDLGSDGAVEVVIVRPDN